MRVKVDFCRLIKGKFVGEVQTLSDKVVVKIKTIQEVDGQKDEDLVTYRGRIKIEEDVAILQYMVKDENGSVRSELRLEDSRLVMNSLGAIERTMVFVEGKKTTSAMRFPFGLMEMGIDTKKYVVKRGDAGENNVLFLVELVYDLWQKDQLLSQQRLEIKVELV